MLAPDMLTQLDQEYLAYLMREKPSIMGRILAGLGIGALGGGLLGRALIRTPFGAPLFFVGPVLGAGAGLLSGLIASRERERLLTDPLYRKSRIIQQLSPPSMISELPIMWRIPATWYLWRKALE